MKRVALTAGALALLAGCGGPGKTTDAATLVPPGATSYLRLRTSVLQRATALLGRFPARGPVLRRVPRVPQGAGPEVDVAGLAGGQVFYTQPADAKAFGKRLDASGRVHAQIRGWTVFTSSSALLHAVEHRRGDLAARSWYVAASATVPSQAALRELTPGWRAAALVVHARDAELDVHRLRAPLPQVRTELVAPVPRDAIAAAGIASVAGVPAGAPALLHELAAAVGGPAVGWVRPGGDLPEVTVVARPAYGPRALRAVARFVALLTKNPARVAVTLDGVELTEVANGAVDLYYGLVGDKLVLTDNAGAAARLGRHEQTLPAATRLPAVSEAWAYLNVARGLPLAFLFSGLFDTTVPQPAATSLAPLRDVLVSASHAGRVATVVTRVDLGSR
jgi:hypothetical protein